MDLLALVDFNLVAWHGADRGVARRARRDGPGDRLRRGQAARQAADQRAEPDIALWTLYPSRRLLNARVSAFLDFLKEAFPLGTSEELAAFIGG